MTAPDNLTGRTLFDADDICPHCDSEEGILDCCYWRWDEVEAEIARIRMERSKREAEREDAADARREYRRME